MAEATAVQKNIAVRLTFAKEHLDVPQHYWSDETKVQLFGRNTQHCVWRKKKAQHTNIKTSSQLWSMVEGASWFGAALLPQGLDRLLSLVEKWIPEFIKTFCRKTEDHLSTNWSSTEDGWCNRTVTQSTEVNQQQNGFNRRKYAFWSGPVRVLTSTRLRCCGMTSRERFKPDIPRILLNWNSFVKRNGPKFLTIVQGWYATTGNVWLRLLLPKEGQPVIKSKDLHTFSILHCECFHVVFNKNMKTYNCLCGISLSRLCLSIVVT